MSRPAVSCSFTMHDTASRYCSRKRESPRASLKARPRSTSVNHDGRGQEPVTVVGSVSSRVALSMDRLPPRALGYTNSACTYRPRACRGDPTDGPGSYEHAYGFTYTVDAGWTTRYPPRELREGSGVRRCTK